MLPRFLDAMAPHAVAWLKIKVKGKQNQAQKTDTMHLQTTYTFELASQMMIDGTFDPPPFTYLFMVTIKYLLVKDMLQSVQNRLLQTNPLSRPFWSHAVWNLYYVG